VADSGRTVGDCGFHASKASGFDENAGGPSFVRRRIPGRNPDLE
jgi:hypothetical protein